jgi:peptide/nickel transport system ATP-binding protein
VTPAHRCDRPYVEESNGAGERSPNEPLDRRPYAVSDGQLQRACLVRALALRPRYVVCDEITSMLDASTTAARVSVLETYRVERGAGVLAISHDEALLDRWASRVQVLAPT